MGTLLADVLKTIPGSDTNAQPAMALVGLSGEPLYCIAWKGPRSTDSIHLSGAPAISGASSDVGPALAASETYLATVLYLAWKPAGGQSVTVSQCVLAEDGFPVQSGWTPLATQPAASTDAAPALAAGPGGALYLVWKTPGANAPLAWSVHQAGAWSTPEPIPTAETDLAPAVSASNLSSPVLFRVAWNGAVSKFPIMGDFTPGEPALNCNYPVGYATDAAPALAPAPIADTHYLVWKQEGAASVAFTPVTPTTTGDVTTLPQVETSAGVAAVNWSNTSSGFGAEPFNSLVLAWRGESTGHVIEGAWTIPTDPAPGPAAGLGSNSNYFLYSDAGRGHCNPLTDVEVTLTITEGMLSDNGFGFQLNANTPRGKKCVWQQYAIVIDPDGEMWSVVDNWDSAGSMILQWDPLHTLTSPTLPAGYVLKIKLEQKTDGTVTGATYTILGEGGVLLKKHTRKLTSLDISPQETTQVGSHELSQIYAMQMNIVGHDGGHHTTFSSGAGTITYAAGEVLKPLGAEPGCAQPDNGTGETANTLYGVLPAGGGKSLTQSFAASTTVPMIHRRGAVHGLFRRP